MSIYRCSVGDICWFFWSTASWCKSYFLQNSVFLTYFLWSIFFIFFYTFSMFFRFFFSISCLYDDWILKYIYQIWIDGKKNISIDLLNTIELKIYVDMQMLLQRKRHENFSKDLWFFDKKFDFMTENLSIKSGNVVRKRTTLVHKAEHIPSHISIG